MMKENMLSAEKESCQALFHIVKIYPSAKPKPMSELLDESELTTALKKSPEWEIYENTIFRSMEFEDFSEAIEFVNTVADLAEEAGHHPDIGVSYATVTLTLVTHDEGGVTVADVEMAQRLDNLID